MRPAPPFTPPHATLSGSRSPRATLAGAQAAELKLAGLGLRGGLAGVPSSGTQLAPIPS